MKAMIAVLSSCFQIASSPIHPLFADNYHVLSKLSCNLHIKIKLKLEIYIRFGIQLWRMNIINLTLLLMQLQQASTDTGGKKLYSTPLFG
jgi:hypothetical protein